MGPFRAAIVLLVAAGLVALSRADGEHRGAGDIEGMDKMPEAPEKVHNREPQASMYELAMERTLLGVKAGKFPDPALRLASGEPGTMTDALFPDSSEFSLSKQRRRLGGGYGWKLFGVNVNFGRSLSLAALNSSSYRYDSVSYPNSIDWRTSAYMTPIQIQADCQSCWAMAALDSIAMMKAIANNAAPVPLSTQQVCDCSDGSCCQGGWPEDAYSYVVSNGNVTDSVAYTYRAYDSNICLWNASYPAAASITGWELVPAFNMFALLKAVSMQPTLVYLSASSTDFQTYVSTAPGTSGFKLYSGNCSSDVNHAVLVVGYSLSGGYWILKNTWFTSWGHNGYMYMAMTDGEGKCGMLSITPMYPVNFPSAPVQVTVVNKMASPVGDCKWWKTWKPYGGADPCANTINPCGGGWCYGLGGIARCYCPAGYSEAVLVPTSKCIPLNPCTSTLVNPCGGGSCTNVGDGSYVCQCSTGYLLGSRVDGAPTCVPAGSSAASTYVAVSGDTCSSVQTSFGVSPSTFALLNPLLDCTAPLIPGSVVSLGSSTSVGCTNQYAVRKYDTCDLIAWAMKSTYFYSALSQASSLSQLYYTYVYAGYNWAPANQSTLLALNPTLDCTSLYLSQTICVNGTTNASTIAGPAQSFLSCGSVYTASSYDTCNSIAYAKGISYSTLIALNPGLNCNTWYLTKGYQVCIAPNAQASSDCTKYYTVKQGDSCPFIWNAANLTQLQFQQLNPGIRCHVPYLVVGQQVCINSSSVASFADPGFYAYATQPNDTMALIQAQFSSKCQAWSITPDRIAAYNNLSAVWNTTNLYPGYPLNLTIPCVVRIGASCGCAPSNPVCGADGVTYQSFCHANCYFALPVTSGQCSTCTAACSGRAGLAPSLAGCGGTCPYPYWAPPYDSASQQYSNLNYTSPQCEYAKSACTQVCQQAGYSQSLTPATQAWNDFFASCYTQCFNCARVPCNGPVVNVTSLNIDYVCDLCGPSTTLNTTMCVSAPATATSRSGTYTWCTAKCSYFYFPLTTKW